MSEVPKKINKNLCLKWKIKDVFSLPGPQPSSKSLISKIINFYMPGEGNQKWYNRDQTLSFCRAQRNRVPLSWRSLINWPHLSIERQCVPCTTLVWDSGSLTSPNAADLQCWLWPPHVASFHWGSDKSWSSILLSPWCDHTFGVISGAWRQPLLPSAFLSWWKLQTLLLRVNFCCWLEDHKPWWHV